MGPSDTLARVVEEARRWWERGSDGRVGVALTWRDSELKHGHQQLVGRELRHCILLSDCVVSSVQCKDSGV